MSPLELKYMPFFSGLDRDLQSRLISVTLADRRLLEEAKQGTLSASAGAGNMLTGL